MAVHNKLWISAELAEKIRVHGAQSYPYECCGALFGRDSSSIGPYLKPRRILGLLALVNRREDSPRNRFSVTPRDVMDAEQAAQSQGLHVIGWYHSHPDHPARPSEYDREHAWPWYSYVIVCIENAVPQEMTSWRLDDNRADYSEELIEIDSETDAKS